MIIWVLLQKRPVTIGTHCQMSGCVTVVGTFGNVMVNLKLDMDDRRVRGAWIVVIL